MKRRQQNVHNISGSQCGATVTSRFVGWQMLQVFEGLCCFLDRTLQGLTDLEDGSITILLKVCYCLPLARRNGLENITLHT
jgi:hypothetical protein